MLRSFIREPDRVTVLSAVRHAFEHRASVHVRSGTRAVTVDPIADDSTGLVHAAWLQVGRRARIEATVRPAAWAFEWDLTTGLARRSAIVSSTLSWASLGIEQERHISDGLAKLPLGTATGSVLASLVSAGHGTVLQRIGLEQRPTGDHRVIQFTARFSEVTATDGYSEPRRIIRGVSVDLGPAEGNPLLNGHSATHLGDWVAQSLATTNQYRAILDPNTLRLLYWFDEPPNTIAVQSGALADSLQVLHPDDVPLARRTVAHMRDSAADPVQKLNLRLLTTRGIYEVVPVTVRTVELDERSQALLLTLHLPQR